MIRYNIPAVTITGQHGRLWTTKPTPGQSGLVAVLQVPSSKFSDSVRAPDFTVAAMDRRADLLVTADARGHVYVFDIRQNRFNRLDKTGCPGTAALVHGPRMVFVAFTDGSIRCYDASKGTAIGMLKEHRSPVRHMEVNRELNELMSTSIDGVLLWDLKKLRRKRVLGSGPYGALQASYTADGLAVVTHFKDGSFYIWSVGNFALVRSFTLPVAPSLRPLQTAFCLSPDGHLLVSCGSTLPVLLVYSVIGGTLRYGVGLPAPPAQLDVDTATAAAAAAAAAAAEAGAAGAAVLPSVDAEDPRSQSAAALAAKLPMSVGVQQVQFLPDSATVAAMMTDGSIAFVDVLMCSFVGAVPYSFPNRPDGSFSTDARMQHMALTADGKVFLYDLAGKTSSVQPPRPLPRVLPSQLDKLVSAVAMEHLRRQREQERTEREGRERITPRAEGSVADAAYQTDSQQIPDNRVTPAASLSATASAPAPSGGSGGGTKPSTGAEAGGATTAVAGRGAAAPIKSAAAAGVVPVGAVAPAPAAVSPGSAGALAGAPKPDAAVGALNRIRLEALLEAFGEYPSKYRLMIWDFLLKLPHNTAAFSSLAGLGLHPVFRNLQSKLPLSNRALTQRLAATLSQLAHWCPVFAESSFLPDLVFPFVKLFASTPSLHGTAAPGAAVPRSSAALDERCFETLATLLSCGWMRGWWDRFPHPPLGLLTRLQDLLSLHDAPLAAHFNTYRGGLAGVVWPQLATLWTELLTRSDWLRLWDHCITAGPDLLYFFVVAYFISLRAQVMGMDTDHKLANWMAGPPPVDMGEILKVAYLLRNRTPEALRPTSSEWQPLPQGPTYTEFKEFPAGAVELFAADRKRIKESEDAIMRRRAVVSELEMRTRAVAMQAASLSTERQQLAALEEQRRAMLRQLEADTATEMARLDDRAKEEKLKQIAAVEKAYQANLLEVRATWHRELEFARAETAHKRAMAAQQLRSRQEDEQIKALEFHAQQRMREMEDDVRRTAVASAVRDELLAQQIEVEAKQRAKLKEWEIDDELRKQRLQHENERRAQLAMAAEEGAARSAAALEAQALAIQVEDHVMKVDGQRRLRRMAEDAALTTAEARAAEDARMAAREAADQEAMRLRARADMAWYEAEQMRREQFLEQERQQMEAAADAARRKLVDTEAAARTMAAQSELLERRRHLERQNAAEEAQTRRLVGVMAMERGRDAVLVSDLEAKEGEMKANLEHYARVGSMQREVEATEAAAAVALLAKLDEQQRRELIELRKLHEAALERLARDLEGQAADAAAKRRAELRAEHLAAIRVHQQAFARRKEELNRDLIREQGRRLRKAAEAAAAAAAAEAADGGGDTPREDHPPPPPPPPPPCDHNQNMYESVPSPPLWRHQQSAGGRRVPTQSAAAATGGGGDVNVSDKDSGGGSGGGGGGGGGAGFRPPAAVAADAARHTDMVLRALGIGSETSTAPTASDSSAHGPRITPVGTVTGSDGFAFTPRRQHHHTYDFLSDSNLTPASFISSVTTSLAPSPERFVFRRPPVATVASAMAPPGVATATATATATVTATPASTDVELQGPMMEVAAAVEQEHTQGSVAGGWPPGVGPTRPRSAAAAAAGAVATSPASVVSGTASTDTLSQSRETALPRSTSAGSGAAAASGGGGGGSTTTSGSAGAGSGGGGGGGGTAAAASAEAAKSLGPCRSWPGAVMPSALPPLREEQEEEDEEPLCFVTPSLSPSSFLPLITPSTRGATSTSTSITSFLNSSTSHAFRSNLDRPGSATAAKQRAALTFTRVVSPTQQQQRSQQQQSSGTRESTCSPSSVTGGSSANPGGAVLIEEYGHVSQRHTAGGGVVTSGSSLLDTSTNMATAAAAPPTQHFTDSDEGMQQSGLRGGPSQGAVNAGEAFVSKAGVMTTTTTTTTATVTATATGTSSPSSSWSSLQRSGLLGLSQPLNPPPVLPLPQQQQQQPSQGQAAPSGSWYGTGRYDTAAVSGRDAIAALAAAALDTISTTTGMTSLTSISTFTSHISFTPAVVRYQQQQQQQLSQQQSGSRQQQQQPQQSKSQFEAIATPASTASSSYSTAGTNPQADRGGGGAAAAATAAAASSDSVGHTGSGTEFSSGSSPWPPPPPPRGGAAAARTAAAVGAGRRRGGALSLSSDYSPTITGLSGSSFSTSSPSDPSGPERPGPSHTSSERLMHSSSEPLLSSASAAAATSGFPGLRAIMALGTSGSSALGTGFGSGGGGGTGSGSGSGLHGDLGRSSSSAGFQSLRNSGSSSAVLLGGLAVGAVSPPGGGAGDVAAAAAAAGVRTAPGMYDSSLSSSGTSDGVGGLTTASLRARLGSTAALYGSILTSSSGTETCSGNVAGGGGPATRTGGGGDSGSGTRSSYGERSSLTRSSLTATTDTPGSSAGYAAGLGQLALLLGSSDASSGIANLWSGAAAAATGSSSGTSADDVSEILRLLRLSAKDDLGPHAQQQQFPLVLPLQLQTQSQPESQSHALLLPPPQQQPQQQQYQEWRDSGSSGREGAQQGSQQDQGEGAHDQQQKQQQQQQQQQRQREPQPVLVMPSKFSEPHSKAYFPLTSGGLDPFWSVPEGPGGGGAPTDTAVGPQGFGSRVGSSASSSRQGSEMGANLKAAAAASGKAGGGGGGFPLPVSGVQAAAAIVGRSGGGGAAPAAAGRHRLDQGADDGNGGGGSDDDSEADGDADDASIVAVATPYPLGGRPSPDEGFTPAPEPRHPAGDGGGGDGSGMPEDGVGGGSDGNAVAQRTVPGAVSADSAASDLFESSPGSSTLPPFPEGFPATPGGASNLLAQLQQMGIAISNWGDGATTVDDDDSSMTPTTITGLTSLYDDEGSLTATTRAAIDDTATGRFQEQEGRL